MVVKHNIVYNKVINGEKIMKRYIAPFISAIAVALIIVAFGLFYFLIFKEMPGTGYIRFIFIAITIVAVGVMVAVLIQRIREIKEGDEDDLGKY